MLLHIGYIGTSGRESGVLIQDKPGLSPQKLKANAVYDQEASRMNTGNNCIEFNDD